MASQHIFKRNHAFDLCSKIHKIFTRFDLCRKLTPSRTGGGFCFFLAKFLSKWIFFLIENISFKIENISMNYLNRFVSLHHGRAAAFVFRSTIFPARTLLTIWGNWQQDIAGSTQLYCNSKGRSPGEKRDYVRKYFFRKRKSISTKSGKIRPFLMAGLSALAKVLQSWQLPPPSPSLFIISSLTNDHFIAVYFCQKYECISI